MMFKNSYVKALTEIQTLAYILRCVSEGKNEDQISEIFDDDGQLVKIWIETLIQFHYIAMSSFNELTITSEGQNYLQKSHVLI